MKSLRMKPSSEDGQMSIRPIDIQTLLVQMSQVGKDQAAVKEGVALQASIQGAEEQKKRDDAKEAIKGAEEGEAATKPIKDRQGRAPQERGQREEGASATPPEEGPKPEGDIVRDPSLGTHIDLTG